MQEDPFRHLPYLRTKIKMPEESRFRTLCLQSIERELQKREVATDWLYSESKRESLRQEALSDRSAGDLWIFGYGSLMWDPSFHFSEVRRGYLSGYSRHFNLKDTAIRGTEDQPALMAGLDSGSCCHGLVFRLPENQITAETKILWRREAIGTGYVARFLPVTTDQGVIQALCFTIDQTAKNFLPNFPYDRTVEWIATAQGYVGTNYEYLDNIATHFKLMQINDSFLMQLRDDVAAYREKYV